MSPSRVPAIPLALGVGGLIPFAGLSAAVWIGSPLENIEAARYLAAYGAVILSFVGALHWGFAMVLPLSEFDRGRVYGWSAAPAIAAWLALMLPTRAGLLLIAVMFVAHYGMDRALAHQTELPPWYLRLRFWLTLGAVASLLAAVARSV